MEQDFYFLDVEENYLFKVFFVNKNKENRPKLGDFLILENEEMLMLTRVEKENYFLDYNEIKEKIERIKELGVELLENMEKEELSYLVYYLVPLAILNKKTKVLNPSYRNIPLHLEIKVRKPSFYELCYFLNQEYLKNKNYSNFVEYLKNKEINETNIFKKLNEFKELFNGEIIGFYNNIPIIFNINKFFAKRTGVFARTGYGKSNAVKTLLLKIIKLSFLRDLQQQNNENKIINDLILIYDVNGEYAFTNEQNIGFFELFEDNYDKFLVLTNKKFSYEFIKPLKIDFSSLEINEIIEILIEAFGGEEIKAYTYFEEVDPIWLKELFKIAIDKEKDISKKSEKEFSKSNIKNIVHFVITYLRDLLQILSSNLKNELRERYFNENRNGKTNIVKVINELKKEIAKNPDLEKKLKTAALKDVNIGAVEWRIKKVFDNLYHPLGLTSKQIREWYDNKKMVVIDLSSLDEWSGSLISSYISKKIFQYSQELFLENKKYNIITVFEEAQNLLEDITKSNNIFVRLAKEGRKFNIAMFAITQQPSGISSKILSQLDNFLVFHLLNDEDINSLSKANSHYSGLIKFLLKYEPIKGQCFFYSSPEQPFVIQLQLRLFNEELKETKEFIKNLIKKEKEKEQKILEEIVDLI